MNEELTHSIDPELMRRVACGDREAFAELYDHLAVPLYTFARRILHDVGEAEDLLQEVFMRIWAQAGSYDPQRGTPFAWAVTLTRFKAMDRLRAQQRRERLHDAADSAPAPSSPAAEPPDAELLQGSLGKLPPDQREAISLAFFSGLTQPEIAAKLCQPLGTVKARIRRGMLKLRDSLTRTV